MNRDKTTTLVIAANSFHAEEDDIGCRGFLGEGTRGDCIIYFARQIVAAQNIVLLILLIPPNPIRASLLCSDSPVPGQFERPINRARRTTVLLHFLIPANPMIYESKRSLYINHSNSLPHAPSSLSLSLCAHVPSMLSYMTFRGFVASTKGQLMLEVLSSQKKNVGSVVVYTLPTRVIVFLFHMK